MKINTSERLKQIMKDRNLKQVDILNLSLPFQKKLNIKMGKSTLSQYVNGVQSPDQNRIYLLSKTLNVSEPWLMGYDVPMDKDFEVSSEDIALAKMFSQVIGGETSLDKRLVTLLVEFSKLDQSEWEKLEAFIDSIKEGEKKE